MSGEAGERIELTPDREPRPELHVHTAAATECQLHVGEPAEALACIAACQTDKTMRKTLTGPDRATKRAPARYCSELSWRSSGAS
jgi:hypothetical protein